jgi:hypothetical protein
MTLLERARELPEYRSLMGGILRPREQFDSPTIKSQAHSRFISSVNIPLPDSIVIFEAHKPYSVPTNYYQGLSMDGIVLEDNFTSGSFRGLVFLNDSVLLLSNHAISGHGSDYSLHYVAILFSRKELSIAKDGSSASVSFSGEKEAKDVFTGESRKHTIRFSFAHSMIGNRMIDPAKALESDLVKNYIKRFGDANAYLTSSKLMGFTITTPFILPHPHTFRFYKELGFESRAQMAFESEKELMSLLGI